MQPSSISRLTCCGIDELPEHGPRAVTHVPSLLDPNWPALTGFQAYGVHSRTTLRFRDIAHPGSGLTLPTREAWPNSLMIGFADDPLGREGRLFVGLRWHYGVQLRQRPEFSHWMRRLAHDREIDMAE